MRKPSSNNGELIWSIDWWFSKASVKLHQFNIFEMQRKTFKWKTSTIHQRFFVPMRCLLALHHHARSDAPRGDANWHQARIRLDETSLQDALKVLGELFPRNIQRCCSLGLLCAICAHRSDERQHPSLGARQGRDGLHQRLGQSQREVLLMSICDLHVWRTDDHFNVVSTPEWVKYFTLLKLVFVCEMGAHTLFLIPYQLTVEQAVACNFFCELLMGRFVARICGKENAKLDASSSRSTLCPCWSTWATLGTLHAAAHPSGIRAGRQWRVPWTERKARPIAAADEQVLQGEQRAGGVPVCASTTYSAAVLSSATPEWIWADRPKRGSVL